MSRGVRSLVVVAAAFAVLPLGSGPAYAATPGAVRISGPSPYAACTTPGAGGRVYRHAEVEPHIASNPADPSNLIGVWQQDRWSNGGAHGLMAGYSSDAGRTWRRTTLPFSRCAPGGLDYERATDPWVSIGPDGRAYAVALSFNEAGTARNAVTAATSVDGGRTWRRVRTIKSDANGFVHFNDKESVTAHPTRAGVAYAVWNRNTTSPDGRFRGPAMFSRTTDGGRTWSAPKAIAAGAEGHQSVGNVVVVDRRSGDIYDFYGHFCDCLAVPRIEFVRSRDGGATWSRPHVVGRLDSVGVFHPNTFDFVRTLDFGPSVAIDATDGSLHVAWQSARFSGGGYDEVAISTSTDGGRTWSPPRRGNSRTGQPAFTPTVAVSAGGVVGLSYYDFRRLAPRDDEDLPTDAWLRTSSDGGRTFGADQHVAGPFDMLTAPDAFGYFVGDYEGLTTVGRTFVSFFVQTNCTTDACATNRTDVFAARLVPLPAATSRAA